MLKNHRSPTPQPCTRQIELDSFDPIVLAETVTRAEIEIEQREPGAFCANIISILLPDSELVRGSLNRAYKLRGTYPRDAVMFSFWFPASDPMKTKGFDLAPTDTLVFGQNEAEMEMISKGNDHYGTFTFSQSAFFEIAESVYHIDAKIMDADELILPHCQTGVKAIRQTVQEIEMLVIKSPDLFSQRDTRKHCEELLIHGFLDVLSSQGRNTTKKLRPAAHHRRQFLKKADEYMREHCSEAISLIDLCRAIGTSKRSLQYAFQEEYDMSPMTYLKINRLNQARRELLKRSMESTSVTTIAFRCGCYHLGRFAIDYRTLFGELPSETLYRKSTCRRR